MTDTIPQRATRERILDAADALLARRGFARMTVEDLAQEAGIGKGTVYLSFESKAEIALACIDRMVDRLQVELQAIAARDEPHDARLRAMLVLRVMHRFDGARQHASSIDALLAAFRPQLLERRARHFVAEAKQLAGVLADGMAAGTFAPHDAMVTARALVTATNALLPYSLSVAELGHRRSLELRCHELADVLIDGVRHRTPVAQRAHARSRTRTPRRSQ